MLIAADEAAVPPLFKVRGLKAEVKEDADDGAPAPVVAADGVLPLGLDMTISWSAAADALPD